MKTVTPYTSLRMALTGKGVECWDPSTMITGRHLADQLKRAIGECEACVFVATRRSIHASSWCPAELGALWGAGKLVVVYVAEADISEKDFPPQLQGTLWTSDANQVIEAIRNNEPADDLPEKRKGKEIEACDGLTACSTRWKNYTSLVGVWVEANDALDDRPFSVCDFVLASNGELRFEGYSYNNKGNEYYKWWALSMHIDDLRHRLSYIYGTEKVDETTKDEGFGCITLGWDGAEKVWNV